MRIERGLQPFNNHTLSNGPINTERVLTNPRRPHYPQSTSSLTATADTKNAEKYRLPTHAIFDTISYFGWMRLYPTLLLMQDGAPGHVAAETKEDLHERGIYPIFWPA
jgi:hypothetical protein